MQMRRDHYGNDGENSRNGSNPERAKNVDDAQAERRCTFKRKPASQSDPDNGQPVQKPLPRTRRPENSQNQQIAATHFEQGTPPAQLFQVPFGPAAHAVRITQTAANRFTERRGL